MRTGIILQALTNGLVVGCAYALVALGFGLIYNTTRVFHFAHGAVYAAAAYLFYSALLVVGDARSLTAALVAVAGAALMGALLDGLIYYPLARRGSSLLIQMLSSVGV